MANVVIHNLTSILVTIGYSNGVQAFICHSFVLGKVLLCSKYKIIAYSAVLSGTEFRRLAYSAVPSGTEFKRLAYSAVPYGKEFRRPAALQQHYDVCTVVSADSL
jgi:hypothetical protein